MKKRYTDGFMLAETLIVTIFVAGVLIFLFIQFSKISNSYNEYYKYNSSDRLYALAGIKYYLEDDALAISYLTSNNIEFIDITDCSIFSNNEYCTTLLELENVEKLIVTTNPIDISVIEVSDEEMLRFIRKIGNDGNEQYRLIAKFNDGSFATVRVRTV